jgi:hypothetical protein
LAADRPNWVGLHPVSGNNFDAVRELPRIGLAFRG